MDAKSRADFINSVGRGSEGAGRKICPNCGSTGTGKFCVKCGAELVQEPPRQEEDVVGVAPQTEATGQNICPKCGMPGTGKFCKSCGTPLVSSAVPGTDAQPLGSDTEDLVQKLKPKTPFKILERRPPLKNDSKDGVFTSFFETEEVEEETSLFAEGMPQWSLEPPNVAVRRRRSKL